MFFFFLKIFVCNCCRLSVWSEDTGDVIADVIEKKPEKRSERWSGDNGQ